MQLRCCAETRQPQFPVYMARILLDRYRYYFTLLKLMDSGFNVNIKLTIAMIKYFGLSYKQ